jgi:hypothetical protein
MGVLTTTKGLGLGCISTVKGSTYKRFKHKEDVL